MWSSHGARWEPLSTPYPDHHLGGLAHWQRRRRPPPSKPWVPNGRRRRTRGRLGRAHAFLVASAVGGGGIDAESTHDVDVRGGENVDSMKLRTVALYGSCVVRMVKRHERYADLATRGMFIAPNGTFQAPS